MKKFTPFDFLDYRDYLRGFFEKRKEDAPWYSYKIFGDGVGLDQAQARHTVLLEEQVTAGCRRARANQA